MTGFASGLHFFGLDCISIRDQMWQWSTPISDERCTTMICNGALEAERMEYFMFRYTEFLPPRKSTLALSTWYLLTFFALHTYFSIILSMYRLSTHARLCCFARYNDFGVHLAYCMFLVTAAHRSCRTILHWHVFDACNTGYEGYEIDEEEWVD